MPGNLTAAELSAAIDAGEIDTVVVAFADAQGRLVGKRVSGRMWRDVVQSHGAEACNYLLSVDVDLNTVDGYPMSSWETGYGDMMLVPDLTTLRRIPWQPGAALVMADLQWEDGSAVAQSPRAILDRQRGRLAERGLVAYSGTELRVHRLRRLVSRGLGEGLPRPPGIHRLQRRLQPARDDPS